MAARDDSLLGDGPSWKRFSRSLKTETPHGGGVTDGNGGYLAKAGAWGAEINQPSFPPSRGRGSGVTNLKRGDPLNKRPSEDAVFISVDVAMRAST